MIHAAFSFFAMLDVSSAALPCDLAPAARPASVADYHALALSCLETPPEPAAFVPRLEAEMLALITDARAEAGLPPLALRPALQVPARFHSLDQAWTGLFGHDGAGGRSPSDRIAALDRTLVQQSSRENVSRVGGDFDPADLAGLMHRGLMGSPGHRANILSEESSHMAIGVVQVYDAFVATQLFVAEVADLDHPAPLSVSALSTADLPEPGPVAGWQVQGATVEPDATGKTGLIRVEAHRHDPSTPGRYSIIYFAGPSVDIAE